MPCPRPSSFSSLLPRRSRKLDFGHFETACGDRWFDEPLADSLPQRGQQTHSPRFVNPSVTEGEADAALAASIFHYATYTVNQLKEILAKQGITVRTAV